MEVHASNGLMNSSGGGRFSSAAGQNSVFNMTLEEFQTFSDPNRNFGSMNMDELVKNMWTAEESQAMAAAMGEGTSASGPSLGQQLSLQRQGALALPRTLTRKTVDEVWRDINQRGGRDNSGGEQQQGQGTFGEMTLEDFLVKAGVVKEDVEAGIQVSGSLGGGERERDMQEGEDRNGPDIAPILALSPANAHASQASFEAMQNAYKNQAVSQQQQADWMRGFAQHQMLQHQQQVAAAYAEATAKAVQNGAGPMVVMGGMGMGPAMGSDLGPGMVGSLGMGLGGGLGGGTGMGLVPGSPQSPVSDSHGNGLSSPGNYGMEGGRGRKRIGVGGHVEKVVERRQRRMIKNRESAARSRARKQAYTVELEAEVMQLKEENMKIRKLQEEAAQRRSKQIVSLEPIAPPVASSSGLRRTQTVPW